ncbi:unnamed protein product [Chironomus riparius]|uniref:GB1/RHD3-type G domain-containing protein n=1 Tax=Chironomus riparius TaxID=315576 RepID=A0A9N9RN69_9DIPT|nr:unnamed protein product [Chironomus riparius]
MSDLHPYGMPITILKLDDSKEAMVNTTDLEKILLNEEIKDRKVMVLSLIGAFRGGKSFLLDYFLRFMYAHYPSLNNPKQVAGSFDNNQNWMGDANEPLLGFSWSSGTTRVTTGINMWNDVFLHTMDGTGEKIAIILIDTQGLFDNVTTQNDNSRIFGLGTLVSSVQILNLNKFIQEDQLQYLRYATEFATFTALDSKKTTERPFQKLTFLIRDWGNPDEFEFGLTGGNYFLKDVLKVQKDHKPELQEVRQSISKSYDQINCCLLPYPGIEVASAKNYDGSCAKMDPLFKKELKSFVEQILLPKNLVLKKINAVELTCSEYKTHIETYFKLFQSNDILKVQNVYDATIDSSMNILIEKCINEYNARISNEKELMDERHISVIHEGSKIVALDMFKNAKKMGTQEHEQKFGDKLKEQIGKIFEEWKQYQLNIIKKNQEKLEAESAKRQAEADAKKAEKERIKAEEAEKVAKVQAEQAEKAKLEETKKAEEALKA